MAARKDRELGVPVWKSAWEIAKKLPPEDAGKFLCAYVAYGFGEEVEDSPDCWHLLFESFSERIDMWREKAERNQKIAKSRSKMAPERHQMAPDGNQTGTKAAPDWNQSDTEVEVEVEVEDKEEEEVIESSLHSDSINLDIPLPPSSKKSPKKRQKRRRPSSLEEVREYFAEKGVTEFTAEYFWEKNESIDWVDRNGNPYKDWRLVVSTWQRRHNGESGFAPRGQTRISTKPDFSDYGNNVTKVSNEGWV